MWQQTVPYAAHFLSEHPAFVGQLTRSQPQVRAWLQPYDLLVCLGADVLRMSVHNPIDALPEGMPIVQIAERDWELGELPDGNRDQRQRKETLRALTVLLRSRMTAAQNPPRMRASSKSQRTTGHMKRAKACEETANSTSARWTRKC